MHRSLERTARVIDEATRGLTLGPLETSDGQRWSTANIIEHLLLPCNGTTCALERCLDEQRSLGHRPSLLARLRRVPLLCWGSFPRVEAPERTRPKGMAAGDALAGLHGQLAQIDEALSACEAQFGAGARLANHPVLGGFRAMDYRRFHWQHARHHAKQIRSRTSP